MATKKTTKKATTRKKAPAKRKPENMVFYVLSKRSHLFQWDPIQVFPTYELAAEYRDLYESVSPYAFRGYKVTKVDLVNASVEERGEENIILAP